MEKHLETIPDSGLKDSGTRRQAESGAVRDRSVGKGRYDLISPIATARKAKHYEKGAIKYFDRNWEKGMPLSWFLDSALRHLFQLLAGDTDEDHAAAVAWNIDGYIHTEEMIRRGVLPLSLADGLPIQAVLAVELEEDKLSKDEQVQATYDGFVRQFEQEKDIYNRGVAEGIARARDVVDAVMFCGTKSPEEVIDKLFGMEEKIKETTGG